MTWYQKTGNKYGAKTKEYNGRIYHSKKEAGYAQELDLMIRAKEIKEWKPQVRISLDINGYHICNYIVDFEVTNCDGSIEWHEVKGFETDLYRIKRKILEATVLKENKDIKYLVIK